MNHCVRRVVLPLIASAAALRAAPDAYIGAEVCGRCHPAEFRRQSASEHARALYPAAKHPLAAQFPSRTPLRRAPDFDFRFVLEARGLLVRIAAGDRAAVLPVEWAFGAGYQAVTFVSRTDPGAYLEHYFSYYTRTKAMGITPGQEALPAPRISDAAGFVHRGLDAVGCFQCHSTGPVDISAGSLRPHELGVRCEACHEAGAEHASGGKAPIRNPRRLSPDQLNDLCGKCHRLPPASGAGFDWNNPWNVRFEPAYLSRSACFRKSQDRLSCLTCHAAHEPLRRNDAAYYNAICAGCHAAAHRQATMTDCVGCHMPRVSPRPPLQFVNHRIGVYDGLRSRQQ